MPASVEELLSDDSVGRLLDLAALQLGHAETLVVGVSEEVVHRVGALSVGVGLELPAALCRVDGIHGLQRGAVMNLVYARHRTPGRLPRTSGNHFGRV